MGSNRDRREFWRAHWQRCQALRMTQKDYAKREGLALTVFYGWTKRFKRESGAASNFRQVAKGCNNALSLFGIQQIPTDNQTRYLCFDSWEALMAFMIKGLELDAPDTR